MLFKSLVFLFLFLPVVYFGFWRLRTKKQRYVWLTIASYVFYGTWNYKFCALMAFSTAVSYFAGLGMLGVANPRRRKLFLIVPVTVDLVLLGFFKYFNFTVSSFAQLSAWLHEPVHPPALNIILPVGISFYTFHTISYMVDAYRGVIIPTRNFWEFSCYVSLFSQLVAGPIVRFRQVEADLDNLDQADRTGWLDIGWSFFAIGMMKKVLLADTIAAVINPAWKEAAHLSTLGAWLSVIGYSYQIYFDFSGYSDMAVGLGYLFGIRLPQNFNSPYKARNISDFWRRWHISLSTCLRDYLYIPLGGSRVSANWLVYRNLMITMLLGGLWHGANWTFVVWGGLHGSYLWVEKFFRDRREPLRLVVPAGGTMAAVQEEVLPKPAHDPGTKYYLTPGRAWPYALLTFLLVVVTWVFFRASTFGGAGRLLGAMFGFIHGGATLLSTLTMVKIAVIISLMLVSQWLLRHSRILEVAHRLPWWLTGLFWSAIVILLVLSQASSSSFIYFQF